MVAPYPIPIDLSLSPSPSLAFPLPKNSLSPQSEPISHPIPCSQGTPSKLPKPRAKKRKRLVNSSPDASKQHGNAGRPSYNDLKHRCDPPPKIRLTTKIGSQDHLFLLTG